MINISTIRPGTVLNKIAYMSVVLAVGMFFTTMTVRGAIIERLKKGENLNVAVIGTSLTDANFNAQNWFAQMGAWLNSLPYSGKVTLSNRAVSGTASANLPQFNRAHGGFWQLDQVLANDNPDVIFIEFAINDAYKQFNMSAADSRKNLKAFIDKINKWAACRGKNVEIIVQTMNNTGPRYAPAENDVGPYYQAWREEAAASKVLLIDHYPNWIKLYKSEANHATWKKYIPDDIHPNTLGTTKIILPEIKRVLNNQSSKTNKSMGLGSCLLGTFCCVRRKRKTHSQPTHIRFSRHTSAIVELLAVIFIFITVMTAQGDILLRLEKGENLNVAAIGTSLTDPNFRPQNWCTQMGAWLNSLPYSGKVTLFNRAVTGTASTNLPSRPQGGPWQLDQVLAYDNPDVIFIEFAINDAFKEFNISVNDSRNNLKALIDRTNAWALSHGKSVEIIVQTMNNTGPAYDPYENDVGPYYQAWREEAAANNVLLIDHYPNWIDLYNSEADHATWKSYIPDDVHPNTLGTSAVILPEIQRVLNAQVPEPSCLIMLVGMLVISTNWRKRIFS